MARRLLGPTFVFAGVMHFVRPRMYEAIMPDYLPAHRELVLASGAAEIAGGLAVMHPRTRRFGGWWLIATLIAVFPANVNMYVNHARFAQIPRAALLCRLPIQAVFIVWVARVALRKADEA